MHPYLKNEVVTSVTPIASSGTPGVVDMTATAADVKFIFTPGLAIDVIRWGVFWTTAKDATSWALTLSKRPIAGTAANKVVISTLTDSAARAAGSVVYQEPGTLTTAAATQSTGADGSLVSVDPVGPYHLAQGMELSVELTDVAATGTGYIFIEYQEYPFNVADVSSAPVNAVKIVAST